MNNKVMKTTAMAVAASFGALATDAYAQSVRAQAPACSVSIIRENDNSAVSVEGAANGSGYVSMGHKETFKLHIDSCIRSEGGVVSFAIQNKNAGTFHVHAGDDLDHSDSSQSSLVFLSSTSAEGREVGGGQVSDGKLDITVSELAHEPAVQRHPEEAPTRGLQLFSGVVAQGEDVERKYGTEDFKAAKGGITYNLRIAYDPRRDKISFHYKPFQPGTPAPLPPHP